MLMITWRASRPHCCGEQRGEAYNLAPAGESEALTEDVIERVRQLVGRGQIENVEDRNSYDLRYWMDASKARESLGWEAEVGLDRTLRSTVAWYLENTTWLEAANRKIRSGEGGPGGVRGSSGTEPE